MEDFFFSPTIPQHFQKKKKKAETIVIDRIKITEDVKQPMFVLWTFDNTKYYFISNNMFQSKGLLLLKTKNTNQLKKEKIQTN